MFSVKPVMGEGVPGNRFDDRDVVVVVPVDVIDAAAADVYRRPQVLEDHGRILNIPCGPSPADFGIPVDPAGLSLQPVPEKIKAELPFGNRLICGPFARLSTTQFT